MINEHLTPLSELKLGLSSKQVGLLKKQGICTLAQLYEALQRRLPLLEKYGFSLSLLERCRTEYSCFSQNTTYGCCIETIPPLGFVLDPKDSPALMQHREETKSERFQLAQHAYRLEEALPDEFLLTDYMQSVRNQLDLGACTGFGSTAAREYLSGEALSPGFAYRGAKMIDGMPDVEGSYQEYCYKFFVEYGQLKEREYTYEQCLADENIAPYLVDAKRYKIWNYLDMMVESEYLAVVLKAALCGMLSDDLTPRPISISVAVYESFVGESARRYGLIPVPFEGESLLGGHAMCVAGYTKLYGECYFVVQNSWGSRWAKDNPAGLPGYALIPENFITKDGLVGELLTAI